MSGNARADLLKRIRKCLALGKSSNEHEAAAAIAKAHELMREHAISQEDVDLAEVGEASVKGTCTQSPPLWETLLCHTVCHALGVEAIIGRNLERIYIGRGAAPEVATYAFAVLFRKLKAARAEYVRTRLKRCTVARKRQRADVFSQAWAGAVCRQVERLMPRQPVDDLVGTWVARRFRNLEVASTRAASHKGGRIDQDYWNGREAGSRVELADGIGGGARPQGLLG